ncbi:MAG: alpha/beta hydrolase [Candidatus Hermodarchaeota archaeon]
MKKETGVFEGREVTELFYQSWLPDNKIKAVLVAIHDLTTHSDRFEALAEYFTEKGYGLFTFDLRGHYRNKSDIPGNIDSMDHIQKDIVLFMDFVKNKVIDVKIFLIGHSFGGLISLNYAISHAGLPGVIVSSPSLGMFLDSLFGKKVAKKLAKSFSKFSLNKLIKVDLDQNQLTSDLKILRKYIADKNKLDMISMKTVSELNSSIVYVLDNAPRLICPILVLQSGEDKIVDKQKTKNFYDEVKSEDKTYKEYAGFLHDLWNEKGRAQVFQDMYVWLEKHL